MSITHAIHHIIIGYLDGTSVKNSNYMMVMLTLMLANTLLYIVFWSTKYCGKSKVSTSMLFANDLLSSSD